MKKSKISLLVLLSTLALVGCGPTSEQGGDEGKLPAPQKDVCFPNEYTLTCSSITSSNLEKYIATKNVVKIDLRDSADYDKVHLRGFENVQFFADIYGDGTQLFTKSYQPRYEESVSIIKDIFPMDKTLFLMCQSGGRVVTMMNLLNSLHYDMSKVYNVGGMGNYGDSKLKVENYDATKDVTPFTGTFTPAPSSDTKIFTSGLPAVPKTAEGKFDYAADKAVIKASNIGEYVDNNSIVKIDLRDKEAYATGGHIRNFENIEFFADIYSSNDECATQLFKKDMTPRYKESADIIKSIFPMDKTIFLMCQSGGRVVTMMKILESLGYNMNNVYNVQGMNQYITAQSPLLVSGVKVADYTAATYKLGSYTEKFYGTDYVTNVVVKDKDGVITEAYFSGTYYTHPLSEGTAPWPSYVDLIKGESAFITSHIIGKKVVDIKKLATDGASAGDVLTGATLTSNRLYKAINEAYKA